MMQRLIVGAVVLFMVALGTLTVTLVTVWAAGGTPAVPLCG